MSGDTAHVARPPAEPTRAAAAFLAHAARAVHGRHDVHEVLAWVADAALAMTGASSAGVCLLGHQTGVRAPLWSTAGTTAPGLEALGDLRRLAPLAPAVAGVEVVRVDLGDVLPHLAWRDLLAVPVVDGDGDPQAVLLVASDEASAFDDDHELPLVALAAHLGVALENRAAMARLADLEASRREVVHSLQDAVRPPRPTVAATELGVHYVASDPSAPTGGDLYDWIVLPSGDLHVAVVDIMGKGVAATKDAVAVTHALRLLVLDGCPLERVVTRADAIVTAQNPDLVATVIVGRYSPATGRMQLVGAGHPPALLVTEEGVTEVAAPGIPIGWPGAGSHGIVTLDLQRSDTIVLYTDGLIETTKDIVAGLEALAAVAAETAEYPAPHLARVLVERTLAGLARHDDSLALVLRRRTPPEEGGRPVLRPFEYRFTPNAANVPLARHFLKDWLERLPAGETETDDLLLVATELCANAVRHATGRPGGVSLRVQAEGVDVVLEVEDDGRGLTWDDDPDDELPDPESEAGRGLFLVRALTDEVHVERGAGRTVVRCVKCAVIAAEAALR